MKRSLVNEKREPSPTVDTVNIPHDPVNEQIVIAAAMADDKERDKLVGKLKPEAFLTPIHRQIWTCFSEMSRKHLGFDPATVQQILGSEFDIDFLLELQASRPSLPPNLDYHVGLVLLDQARFRAIVGPIAQLLEAVKDNRTPADKLRGLSKQVAGAFEGYADRKYLRDGAEVVKDQMADLEERRNGRACFPCGIDGLDYYEEGHHKAGENRLIPGFKPGKLTVVCGVPGAGKSLFTTRMMLGFAKQKKRVLVGAWEMDPGEILELAACQDLGFSRHKVSVGNISTPDVVRLREKMEELREFIHFMDIPFNRATGDKPSNDRNLDLIQGYLSDVSPEIFIADLWKRCLRYTDPNDEEQALIRQQAMAKELNVHCVLVQQLRSKDVEARADKRPTRESVKGSGAWVEVPDTILGVHRHGLWKNVPDDTLDCLVLKQRFGSWPLVIQFKCDPVMGSITGGTTVPYNHEEKKDDTEDEFGIKGTWKARK